ncbi:hypothetical protein [Natrinema versiforme]|uniref:Uncharacterized protein n=1 Tax=Natrinema versiforme JCM 10478 TaxID=1227496 RepID=L9Y395_9EURY|nr:hypothetical protein [Natrinema versiforme]ELY68539.1 hypothetical protein C489_07560 [Natrinema versiforme JCM 10478]
MTDHHDHDTTTDGSMGAFDEIDDLEALDELDAPAERATSAASDAVSSGTLPILGGGLLLVAAIRSMARNRARAIPLGIAGSGLVGFGLQQRRSSGEDSSGVPDVEGGTEGKETSDQASAAAERVDSGRESEIQPDGEISDERGIDDTDESGSQIEFTDEPGGDEDRSRPDLGDDEAEPRRETDTDDVAVDVSNSAMADETSEATGPDPTQAQPTQTADTEPEASPAEDASDMKVEPSDDDEDDSETEEADSADDADDSDDESEQ